MCELSFPADYETCTTKEGQRTKDCPPFRHAYRSHRFFVKEKWGEKEKGKKGGKKGKIRVLHVYLIYGHL